MATSSPFSLLDELFNQLTQRIQPPPWLIEELQRKLVIVLNHVLMQEQQATQRLVRQRGRVVMLEWRHIALRLRITPAGLLDVDATPTQPDLRLAITETSPTTLLRQTLGGEQPAVRIEGDVQLAAEVNWLTQHVRWDVEHDLSRVVGDAGAHHLGQLARAASAALKRWLASRQEVRA